MTIIDTTLYANGALRLSRHGAGKGGNILVHVATDEQFTVHPECLVAVEEMLQSYTERETNARYVFEEVKNYEAKFEEAYRS
jgi:hypothetical protein